MLKKLAAVLLLILAAAVISAVPVFAETEKAPVGDAAVSEKPDISKAEARLVSSFYTYTGKKIFPVNDLTVTLGGRKLVPNTDYTVNCANNTEVGYESACLIISGKGKYRGVFAKYFTIAPAVCRMTSLTTQRDAITVNWEKTAGALAYQVLYSTDSTFSENVHSTTVTGRNYVNLSNIPTAGEKYYIKVRAFITSDGTLSGKRFGTYSAVKSKTVKDNIKSVSIPYASYTYSGKSITPPLTVKCCGGRVLTEGRDYTVVYGNNVKVGKASITVTGKGNYEGTFSRTFIIKPAKNSVTGLLTDGRARFTASWKSDPAATGYQVMYSTDKSFAQNVRTYSTTGTQVTFSEHVEPGRTYYVKVRSYLAANNTRYGNYSAARSVTTLNRDINSLRTTLNNMVSGYPGSWSVYVKNLRTGETLSLNDRQYYAASLMKLYCMAATYEAIEEGRIRESEVSSLLNSMITVSSNDAFNRLVYKIGKTAVRDWIIRNGYKDTVQRHGFSEGYGYPGTVIEPGSNLTTAADCGRFFESVYRGECVSKEASAKMLALLKKQYWTYKLPQGIPSGVVTANKTGEVPSYSHDCMLVFLNGDPYIMSVMTENRNAALYYSGRMRELSRTVYNFFAYQN